MPEAGEDIKSPKTTRRPRSAEDVRQVHFEEKGSSNGGTAAKKTDNGTAAATAAKDCQPTSFPAIGPTPGAGPSSNAGRWFTAADPTRSLGAGLYHNQQQFFLQQQQQQQPNLVPPPHLAFSGGLAPAFASNAAAPGHQVTYIGNHPQLHPHPLQQHPVQFAAMANYANAGPPPSGVTFQPPVPDSTFGPMAHLYVPRFDAGPHGPLGGVPPQGLGLHVGPPSPPRLVQLVPVAEISGHAAQPAAGTASLSVLVPKTTFLNGYQYYASAFAHLPPAPDRMEARLFSIPRLLLPSRARAKWHGFRMRGPPCLAPCPRPARVAPSCEGAWADRKFALQQPVPAVVPVAQPGFVTQQFVPAQLPLQPSLQPPHPQPPVMMSGQAFVAVPASQVAPPSFVGASTLGMGAEVNGVGLTQQEESLRQIQFAHNNKLFEPQDFKPGDDDANRFYYVRELDGNWTQRSRYSIDQMACRWYVTDEGWFYAVRLAE
ncbi:hypothetical protein RJ55_03401 [Drechmeria coniospora]|nr:hypothetical protein RJ55_03401 [Drechmeria coniospora]